MPLDTPPPTGDSLASLQQAILDFAKQRDWLQFHKPKNLAMAISIEAGELMEHFLWLTPDQADVALHDPAKREQISHELADILMFTLEFANIAGIDPTEAIKSKMLENAKRYPVDKARGVASKYTEL